jgi:hypothetical protein
MVTSDYQATRVRISKATREAEFLPPILLSSEDSLWAMSGRWFAKDQDDRPRIEAKQTGATNH